MGKPANLEVGQVWIFDGRDLYRILKIFETPGSGYPRGESRWDVLLENVTEGWTVAYRAEALREEPGFLWRRESPSDILDELLGVVT